MNNNEITWVTHPILKRKFEIIDDTNSELNKKRSKKPKLSEKKSKTNILSKISLEDTESENNSSDTANTIYSHENHVYFYTDIKNKTIISLRKEIRNVINKLVKKCKIVENYEFTVEYPPIVLHINSPGGSIFSAFNFIDYMTQIKKKYPKIKFHSIVEGRAASAATLISVTADKRFITEYGYMLIHQLWSCTGGKYNEIKDDVSNLDVLMRRIKEIYQKYTKIPDNQIDEILKHDLYWDAETCLKYKLVDAIIN